jgi:hypothetical protein
VIEIHCLCCVEIDCLKGRMHIENGQTASVILHVFYRINCYYQVGVVHSYRRLLFYLCVIDCPGDSDRQNPTGKRVPPARYLHLSQIEEIQRLLMLSPK